MSVGMRYLWRELIPRTVVFALMFGLLDRLSLGLLQWQGSLGLTVISAIGLTGFFAVFGAGIMSSGWMQAFLTANRQAWWFVPFNIAVLLGVPALLCCAAVAIAPGIIWIDGILGIFVGAILLNVACALTHDYGV